MVYDQEDSGCALNAVIWTLFVLAVIAIALRIRSRARRKDHFGWDDWVMVFSLVRCTLLVMYTVDMMISYSILFHASVHPLRSAME